MGGSTVWTTYHNNVIFVLLMLTVHVNQSS